MQTLFPLIISNTDITLLSECELKWFRSRCQWLRKDGFNIDLTAGSVFAEGLAMARKLYYELNFDEEEAVDNAYKHVYQALHEAEFQDELKSPERVSQGVRDYFRKFPLSDQYYQPVQLDDDSYAIEYKFSVELPIMHPELNVPLIFKGKLDMLASHLGRFYIEDDKTCKQISSKESELLETNSQFLGYAWIVKKHLGIDVYGANIRKIAFQKSGNKIEEFEFPITDYTIDLWYKSLLNKLQTVVDKYLEYKTDERSFKEVFIPDYSLGCNSFFKTCPFKDGCLSENGEKFIAGEFEQIHWDSEERKEVPLSEFIKMVGL